MSYRLMQARELERLLDSDVSRYYFASVQKVAIAEAIRALRELDDSGDLYAWLETDVIAMTTNPLGWEFLVEGEDGEPTTEDPFLVVGDDLLEALRQARAVQAEHIKAAKGGAV